MNRIAEYKKIHFIGVGGVSMRSLALFASQYAEVSGSDRENSPVLDRLRLEGIDAYVGHNVRAASESGLVVYTAAIARDDPELAAARDFGVPVMERREFLRLVADCFKKTVAVAGSHGKTTVTAMIARVFDAAAEKFTAHIGGEAAGMGCFADKGRDWFVTEACEYNRSFLSLTPHIGVVLNVEFDHPDCYDDYDDIKTAFNKFRERCRLCVAPCGEFEKSEGLATFGTEREADYRIYDIAENDGKYSFKLAKNGRPFLAAELSVAGAHNVFNAAAAAAVCDCAGIKAEVIESGLRSFAGVKRRFECRGMTAKGARVVCDYAHHPAEIVRAVDTARRRSQGRIIAVFEPHTYSRTAKLFDGFLECFYWADELVLLPTFAAREKPSDGKGAEELYRALSQRGAMPYFAKDYREAARHADFASSNGDLILVLGAGSVDEVCDLLLE